MSARSGYRTPTANLRILHPGSAPCKGAPATIGHGAADAASFLRALQASGILAVVDVRRFPASRRHPHFSAAALDASLAAAGIAYVPAPELGGRRRPEPDAPDVALREPGFRGYAGFMRTPEFRAALDRLLVQIDAATTAILCGETLWWRCHRRLIADALTLLAGRDVVHLIGGKAQPHRPTPGVRRDGDRLVYDDLAAAPPP